LIPGVGTSSHGSSRWLAIGPLSFQPSEAAKIGVIIFLATVVEKIPKQMNKASGIFKVLALLIPLVGVIAYSNLSTAVIVLGIAVCMLFVASSKYKPFVVIGILGAAFILIFIFAMGAGYRSDRVDAWLHPETAGDSGYQTLMGLYAIGSGGLFGKGLGQSLQKMGHVPESQNDMIFTIICEELGLFGAICVILLYLMMIWRMMVIANNAKDLFGALLVVGVMTHISLQVILNIAVVTNSIPNTGVTLPFISYGGTSVIFLMMEIGLVLSVSKGITLESMET
jgi:cell division protein FtsW